jgi:hypothetical protein
MSEVRAEVVADLVAGRIREVVSSADNRRAQRCHRRDGRPAEERITSHRSPETGGSVYDLTLEDLEVLAAVFGVVGKWKAAPQVGGTRKLGDALKILPTDVVADVLRILAIGGYIPWDDVPEPPLCDG